MFKVLMKLVIAFFVVCFVAGIAGAISRVAVPITMPKDKAYVIDVTTAETSNNVATKKVENSKDAVANTADVKVDKVLTFAEMLAATDEKRGKKIAKACVACHSFDKGGKAKMGPNLWGIIGREVASMEGFKYSDAMKAKGGKWGYEEINEFMTKPKAVVKGTTMGYGGLKKAEDRAALIKWLRTLNDKPLPLP